jgi:hypothetical protein
MKWSDPDFAKQQADLQAAKDRFDDQFRHLPRSQWAKAVSGPWSPEDHRVDGIRRRPRFGLTA